MAGRFDAFVMFAEMRTGSNHLEASLNSLPDVTGYGEVYNPTFLGKHNRFELFGYDMARREADPLGLLDRMIAETDGLPGFRLFHDHDDRVVERVLPDPRIAKIILTRNPLDAYISRKIATETGQWQLRDVKQRKSAKVSFDEGEFRAMLDALQGFQLRVQRALQVTGQTAFHIRYDDINDAGVLTGLARFLGSDHEIAAPAPTLKKQNPGGAAEKVANPADMAAALARIDRFDLNATPNFEPPRPPAVPGFVAHPGAGLLFMPIKAAPENAVTRWMAAIGDGTAQLITGMTQKDLRQWIKARGAYRSFTVARHPVARAHAAFCRLIGPDAPSGADDLRTIWTTRFDMRLPEGAVSGPGAGHDLHAHRAAFLSYLGFVKANLNGQTSLRTDAIWASQTAILQGVANFALPHRIVPEDRMDDLLPALAAELGVAAPEPGPERPGHGFDLAAIYDDAVEKAVQAAYRRDYLTLGFAPWGAG